MENMFESQFLRTQQVSINLPNKSNLLSQASTPRPPPLPAVFRAPSLPSLPPGQAALNALSTNSNNSTTLSVEERAVILARTHLLQVASALLPSRFQMSGFL